MDGGINIINVDRFNILQYGRKKYRLQKRCSITKKIYSVDLSSSEFSRYYRASGKSVKHLKRLGKVQKEFLVSTLTPDEVKLLTKAQKTILHPKIWRYQIKKSI